MADGRLDDLERRIRELDARLAGLEAESAAVRGSLADLTGDRRLVDDGPGQREEADAAADEERGSDASGEDREVVMAPPKGASQAAVEAAVDAVDEPRDRENGLVLRGPRP
jgi:hypothetical protein